MQRTRPEWFEEGEEEEEEEAAEEEAEEVEREANPQQDAYTGKSGGAGRV